MKWAGCNYYVNVGVSQDSPAGTATSMHECSMCEYDGSCPLQKDTEIWAHDAEYDTRVDEVITALREKSFLEKKIRTAVDV